VPNPFNTTTKIQFYIAEGTMSKSLFIFDLQGNLLKQYSIDGIGYSEIIINGSELPAGMYLYTLIVDREEIDTKRMILTH
jgi:hypothetical protein